MALRRVPKHRHVNLHRGIGPSVGSPVAVVEGSRDQQKHSPQSQEPLLCDI